MMHNVNGRSIRSIAKMSMILLIGLQHWERKIAVDRSCHGLSGFQEDRSP
jgi:hypothetical protein